MTIAKELPKTKDEACRVMTKVVGGVARKYTRNHHQDYMDLFQEGMIGVCKAYDKFDTGAGASFSTYAYFWIVNEIQQAVKKNWKTYNNTASKSVEDYNHLPGIGVVTIESLSASITLGKMSKSDQDLWNARVEGKTFQEIADQQGFTTLHRARNRFNEIAQIVTQ